MVSLGIFAHSKTRFHILPAPRPPHCALTIIEKRELGKSHQGNQPLRKTIRDGKSQKMHPSQPWNLGDGVGDYVRIHGLVELNLDLLCRCAACLVFPVNYRLELGEGA